MKIFLGGLVVLVMIFGGAPLVLGQDSAASQDSAPSQDSAASQDSAPSSDTTTSPDTATPISESSTAGPEIPSFPPASPDRPTTFSYGLDIAKSVGAFALVMIVLLLSLKALGRFSRLRGLKGGSSVFTYRGIQTLDNRKYLAAVEIEGRLIVVGVTPDRITPVAHWFLNGEDDGLDFLSVHGSAEETDMSFTLPEEDFPSPNNQEELPQPVKASPKERKNEIV